MQNTVFWIVIGLVLITLIWTGSREKIERQKTLQRILERDGDIDEELLGALLGKSEQGAAYRAWRIVGTLFMVASLPVGITSATLVFLEDGPGRGVVVSGVFFFLLSFFAGLGAFLSSRFCDKPNQNNDKQ